ncbi:MAG TPA: TonB-dependent receptor [Flavisolibacter sp.]|jgi:TonB-linked SusC/RagA family outer membrane protein|nr:TonB-dependent receptor [Flavisolibacter sp.]
MNMRRFLAIALLQYLFITAAFAQKREITGRVVDSATSEPLSGVSVVADRKGAAVATDASGSFRIQVDNKVSVLVFSSVGYTPQTILISEATGTIRLSRVSAAMDEVVVVGYGTQRKSHLTGAISKYKNEKLDEAPVSRLDQALQGKIAGVQIQNTSSEAGSDPRIRVRGLSSVFAGANPLVVVDGHPVPDGLAFVNPADVESVEVLKDAASAAIYGSRGASGVIIVTTKSGKADRPKYSFKASTGAKTAYETYPMMTMTEYGNLLFYEASLKAKDPGVPPLTTNQIMAANERAAYVIEQTLMDGKPTDWQDQALRSATVRNLQLNVSGGSRAARYFISGGYQRDQGMMYHSEYDKYNLRAKLDLDLSRKVKLSFNVNPSFITRERPSVNYIDFVRFYSFLPVYHNERTAAFAGQVAQWAGVKAGDFAQARHFNGRVYTGIMPDGSTWVTPSASDPFATANNTPKSIMETRTINSKDYRVLSSGDLTINLLNGLDFKTLASVYVSYNDVLDFAKRNSARDGDVNRGQYNQRLNVDLLSENTLTYNRKIKDHSFNLLAGFTAQKTRYTLEQAVGRDYTSDNITTLNTALVVEQPSIDGNGNLQGSYSFKSQVGLLSYLGRLTYNYKSKYLLSASFRTDGSSYFAPGKKWGSFPALSLGWMVSEEKFMQRASLINSLKLRGSYGVSGNNRINEGSSGLSDFPFLDLLYVANYPFGAATGGSNSGLVPSRGIQANADLTWERTFQYNAGFDLALLRSAITLTVDAYQSKSDRLLLQQTSMAFTGVPLTWNNIGRVQNRGVEVELTTNNLRRKNLKWTTSLNLSHNKNKLLELGGEALFLNQGERTELYRNMPGRQLIEFFGYRTDGVWLSQQQIDEARAKGLTSNLSNLFVPGGLKLVDITGDNVIDDKDRTVIGDPYAAYNWGITNSFTFKGIDLNFTFQGSQGGQLINGDANYNETKRINKNYNQNRWLSPMFPGDGKTPYSTNGFNWMLTDYVVEDASYYALRELIVGYTLPVKFARLVRLNSARVYFSAQNLYFHSAAGYRGINPEARFTSGPYGTPLVDGYQRGSFPMPKTFLFGIDINF